MKLFELIQSKIDVIRLERRYTRGRDRRSTFVSDAMYVDGEYVYNVSAKASQHTGGSSTSEASKTSTNPSTNGSMGKAASRMQKKRGNSLIMEVNAELERAEREHEMEIEDMMGKIVTLDTRYAVGSGSLPERKKRNRLSRISVRELKWDTEKRR